MSYSTEGDVMPSQGQKRRNKKHRKIRAKKRTKALRGMTVGKLGRKK